MNYLREKDRIAVLDISCFVACNMISGDSVSSSGKARFGKSCFDQFILNCCKESGCDHCIATLIYILDQFICYFFIGKRRFSKQYLRRVLREVGNRLNRYANHTKPHLKVIFAA